MSPHGAIILGLCLCVVVFTPRRWATLGVLAGVLFLPGSQAIAIAGVNVFAMRFIEVAVVMRVISKKEYTSIQWTRVDFWLPVFFAYTTIIFLLRSDEGQAFQIGLAVDALCCYYSFRSLIRDESDIRWTLKSFVWLLLPFTVIILIESVTLNNPFAVMGGLNYGGDWMRNGRLRCQGSFQHCSLLGTFAACFFALYLPCLIGRFDRKQAWFGLILCLIIIWACNSGSPISSVANIVFCWGIWKFRKHLISIRYLFLAMLGLMACVMESSLFYLPAKVSSITGGDGWHRSYLMEMAFRDLHKWWLAGMHLRETIDWFPYLNFATGYADITNQFVAHGLAAGLPALAFFVILLFSAFREIGGIQKTLEQTQAGTSPTAYLAWGLGATLVMHIANWLGIIYFDQTFVIWYLHLAMISSLKTNVTSSHAATFES